MKPLILLATLLLSLTATSLIAQTFEQKGPSKMPYNTATQEFQYTGTITQDSVGKNVLMVRAERWFKTFYKNPSSVIKEKTDSSIVGKYQFNIFNTSTGNKLSSGFVHYTFKITCRDNQYTYNVTRINLKSASYFGIENWLTPKNKKEEKNSAEYFEQIAEHLTNLESHLKEVMSAKATEGVQKIITD